MKNAVYIEVSAGVRYWEDGKINGVEDETGTLVPFRKGDRWCPRIRLADGAVMDWPAGTVADIHYKVCDDGDYWLCDATFSRVAKWAGDYVPDDFLCHGEDGYGDYIILHINGDGCIRDWYAPEIVAVRWRFT